MVATIVINETKNNCFPFIPSQTKIAAINVIGITPADCQNVIEIFPSVSVNFFANKSDIDHNTQAARTQTGPVETFRSGLKTIITPTKPKNIAPHLLNPTTSFKVKIASNVAKIGIVKARDCAFESSVKLIP